MAYGLKYELEATSKKYGDHWTLEIKKDGYSGSEVERNVPLSPFNRRKDSAGTIRGTSLEFQIRAEADFELIEFYTTNKREFLCILKKESNTIWTGYVLPEQYQEPYKPAPVNIKFLATDGLGTLKDIDFTLTGNQSQLSIIRHCLDNLDLDLGYAVAICVHEANHNTSYCPLYQTYEDASIYENMSCYDVLKNILDKYDASITQSRGRWLIMRSADKKATRIIYTSAGAYSTTEAAPTVLALDDMVASGCDVYAIDSHPEMEIQTAGSSIKISHDYGMDESFFDNNLFEDFVSTAFTDWLNSAAFNPAQGYDGDRYFARIPSYSTSDEYLYQQQSVVNVSNQDFVIKMRLAAFGYSTSVYVGNKIPLTMAVRFMVKYTGASTYYLDKDDGWKTSEVINSISLTSSTSLFPTWTDLEILTDELPMSTGTLEIRIYRYKSSGPGASQHYLGVGFADIFSYFLQSSGEKYPSGVEYDLSIDGTATGKLDDLDIMVADTPGLSNSKLLYNNLTSLSSGALTEEWFIDGKTPSMNLLMILARTIASRVRTPRQKIIGTFRGEDITYDTIIKHAYNSNREFEILEMQHDVYQDKYKLTLLEILSWYEVDFGVSPDLGVTLVDEGSTSYETSESMACNVTVDNDGDISGGEYIEWQVVNLTDAVQSSGTQLTGLIYADDDDIISLTGITAPSTAGSYKIRARIKDSGDSWVYSDTITVATAPDVEATSIDTISNGTENAELSVTVNYTNAGGAGSVTFYWQILNSGDTVIDSGSVSKSVVITSGSVQIDVTYPTAGTGYKFKAKESDDTAYEESNSFDAIEEPE